jgi:hypothetical protein
MANIVQYGDITPRTAAYVVKDLLKRAQPYMCIEKFGQAYPIPQNSTRTAKFRRYFLTGATGSAGDGDASKAFFTPLSTTPLLEGVTPAGLKLSFVDYTVQLAQYGDYIQITDVVEDTHEDPVLQEVHADPVGIGRADARSDPLQHPEGGNERVLRQRCERVRPSTRRSRWICSARSRPRSTGKTRSSSRAWSQATPNYRTEPIEAAYICADPPGLRNRRAQHRRVHLDEAVRHGTQPMEGDRRSRARPLHHVARCSRRSRMPAVRRVRCGPRPAPAPTCTRCCSSLATPTASSRCAARTRSRRWS